MAAVKLAITSDLHYPITPPARLKLLAYELSQWGPNVLVVAGDLGESLPDLVRCLKIFRDALPCPIWVLPGDQDFWARPPYDSRRLWLDLVPQAVTMAGCGWLEGASFRIEDVAAVGTVAWYDYSTADPAIAFLSPDYAQRKLEFNADALRIDWEWSDEEFAGMAGSRFLEALQKAEEAPEVRHIVAITHFPILEKQLKREPGQGLASAYLGNLTLGHKAMVCSKLRHAVCGHVSTARQATIERAGLPPVEARTLGSAYERPAWIGLTVGG
jgi:hypothetical protein